MGASGAAEIIEKLPPSGQLSICPRAIAQEVDPTSATRQKKPTLLFFSYYFILCFLFLQLSASHTPSSVFFFFFLITRSIYAPFFFILK